MLNTETVLKLIESGFTHDEIMAMENQSTPQTQTVETTPQTQTVETTPQTQTEETKPQTQTQTEQRQEVTAQDILNAISNLGKVIQTGQVQGTRMPAIEQLSGDDVVASIIQPTYQKGDKK